MTKPTVRAINSLTSAERTKRTINRTILGEKDAECLSCKKPIWITCFFDGTGNNFENDGSGKTGEDAVSYSNISKLWYFAHPRLTSVPRTYGLYIQGVGTPCR
jgi:hypothetical protein